MTDIQRLLCAIVLMFNVMTGFADTSGFTCITNSDKTITIAKYTGCSAFMNTQTTNGLMVDIPTAINGLTVTRIGDNAFIYLSLMSVTIPNSITSIGDNAFGCCQNLSNISFPNSITNIGRLAFESCIRLRNITIPGSVTTIGWGAFLHIGLTNITVNPQNPVFSSADGVLFNKNQISLILYPCGKPASSYAVPDTVTSIEDGAFVGSTNLTNITIPKSVTNIANQAFVECKNLTGLYFKGNAPQIDESKSAVFYNDRNLIIYHLPDTKGWDKTFGSRPTQIWKP